MMKNLEKSLILNLWILYTKFGIAKVVLLETLSMFRKRMTVILRSDKHNKKLAKIKFSKQETILIHTLCNTLGMTPEEVIHYAIKSLR